MDSKFSSSYIPYGAQQSAPCDLSENLCSAFGRDDRVHDIVVCALRIPAVVACLFDPVVVDLFHVRCEGCKLVIGERIDLDAAVNAELAVRDEVSASDSCIMSLISVKVSVTHFCCSSVRLFHVSRFIM